MTDRIRVAAYIRVSSGNQAKARTIDSQRRDVPAYCAAQGWTIVDTYEDDGTFRRDSTGTLHTPDHPQCAWADSLIAAQLAAEDALRAVRDGIDAVIG